MKWDWETYWYYSGGYKPEYAMQVQATGIPHIGGEICRRKVDGLCVARVIRNGETVWESPDWASQRVTGVQLSSALSELATIESMRKENANA